MSHKHPSNHDFELLSAYLDGETTSSETNQAEVLLKASKEAAHFHHWSDLQKKRIRKACSDTKAPAHLLNACLEAIAAESIRSKSGITPVITPSAHNPLLLYLSAAALVIAALITTLRLEPPSTPSIPVATVSYDIEAKVNQHYHNQIPALHTSFSTDEAQVYIHNAWDLDITVPELHGATFTGFAYAEFVPDYHTPVLVYHTEEQHTIMIFAFDVHTLHDESPLLRDQQAVSTCVHPDSVHIKNVQGSHVVSWMWDNTWYAGVSAQHGEMLASRLPISR